MYSPVEDNLDDNDLFMAFKSLISLLSLLPTADGAFWEFLDFLLKLLDLSAVEDEAVESFRLAESSL